MSAEQISALEKEIAALLTKLRTKPDPLTRRDDTWQLGVMRRKLMALKRDQRKEESSDSR